MSPEGWLSVSDLAAARLISKQAVSKRLKTFAPSGKVETRRQGREILVNVAQYDRAAGQETDPAQQLRNINSPPRRVAGATDTAAPAAPPTNEGLALKVYSQQRARREGFDAELAKLRIERESGRWIEAHKAQQAWGKELAALVAETETFIVNRLARELAEAHGLDWKLVAIAARDKYRQFRTATAARAIETIEQSRTGTSD